MNKTLPAAGPKMVQEYRRGAIKIILHLGLLANLKVFLLRFPMRWSGILYFLIEETHIKSMLTKFQKFLWTKKKLKKKIKILNFPKNWENSKLKSNNHIFWIPLTKKMKYHEQI